LKQDSKGSEQGQIYDWGVRYLNLKAISLACVVGLSTLVFSGCGNDNGNNNNGNAGNTGTNTSMKARSMNRGTTIDPLTRTRTGNGTSFDRSNAGGYGSAIDDNARGNNRLFGNNDGLFNRNTMNDNNRGGLLGTGIGNGIDEGSGTGRDYRGGLFNTGIGNGIDENNVDGRGNGMLGNGMNDNRGGLFGTGLFSGMMHNDDNADRGNVTSGRTGMNGIRPNGAGTSDSVGRIGGMGVNGTTGLYSNGTQPFNDALVLGNFVIVGKNANGRGAGASMMNGSSGMGSGAQHVLQVTDPQALKALERVKRHLDTNIKGQDTNKLAKDLALVLKHAKEPKAKTTAGKGTTTGGRAATGRAANAR